MATAEGEKGRLLTAEVAQLRSTYTFTARSWLRLIAQWRSLERRPDLYADPDGVEAVSKGFDGSLVFAYKLDWQTVLYAGYGDARELDQRDDLRPARREIFVKVSYAFQR